MHTLARAIRLTVTAAAAALLLFSFGWVASRPFRMQTLAAGQIELTVLHWGDKNEDRIVADLVRDFESRPENSDIRVLRINLGQVAAVNTKLQTMFAGGEPPDVFYLGFEKVADFAAKNLLADIEAFIEQDRAAGRPTVDLDDFYPSVLNSFRYDTDKRLIGSGPLIALAKDFTTVGFYYNRDLFRRAGVPEPSPAGWTWDEFLHAARAIGRLPNCYGADFATWESMIRLFLWTHGLDFGSPDWRELKFDDPRVHEVLDKLRAWFHDEERTLVSAKTQLETGQEPFLAGNVGMAGPFGRWKAPTYRLIEDFDWDFAPLPHAAGQPSRNGVFTVGWGIARQSKHPQQAWRFVKHLLSPHAQELMSRAGLAIPVLRSVAEGPAFSDPSQKPKNYHVYLDAADQARPIDWPADPEYQHQIRVRLEDIYKLNEPVAPAMARVQREWEAKLQKATLDRNHRRMPWAIVAWCVLGALCATIGTAMVVWWRRRPGPLAMREEVAGSLMIGPWVVGFFAFTAFPIVLSLLLAFTRWSGMATLDTAEFVGLDNIRAIWSTDGTFRRALAVTAWYALLAVPSSQIAALAAAVLMNRAIRGIGIFRAIWYLPSVLAGVGMAVMWKWVFHHEHGLLKAVFDSVGIWSPAWFEKDAATWGVPAFAIVNLWTIGGTMMIYIAGLKGIPGELYEAARIDGAVGWKRFTRITLPMLSPIILFNLIIAVIASFQVFTLAYVMTAGGPGDATRFYVVYLYNQAFDFHEMGYASGMAWMLFIIVLVLTMLMMWLSRRFVYYEALKA